MLVSRRRFDVRRALRARRCRRRRRRRKATTQRRRCYWPQGSRGVLGARGAVRSPCIREHALSAARDRAQGVDTFMNAMIDKSALVTKHWKLQTAPEADSPFFFLSVRHYSLTKMYVLSVSGLLVLVNGKVSARASAGPCLVLRSAL